MEALELNRLVNVVGSLVAAQRAQVAATLAAAIIVANGSKATAEDAVNLTQQLMKAMKDAE